MSGEPTIPLDYGQRPPPKLRWLILLIVWPVGLVIWAAYFAVLALLLLKVLV